VPELPEAETIARDLDRSLKGAKVAAAAVTFAGAEAGPVPLSALAGRTVTGASRRGKCVLVRFSGELTLIASLRMTGQFLFGHAPGGDPAGEGAGGKGVEAAGGKGVEAAPDRGFPTHVRAVFPLAGFRGPGGEDALLYRDIRKFGRLFLAPDAQAEAYLPTGAGGHDPFTIPPEELHRRLSATRSPIKNVLMNQTVVCGLGNIYATEILFEAGISPSRPAAGVTRPESDIILKAARSILTDAISHRGSTVENYTAPLGPGGYQALLKVYGRAKQPCPRCGAPLDRAFMSGRTTVYCPVCQK
jgi:formamidopyrimidine-DNA glycosylase